MNDFLILVLLVTNGITVVHAECSAALGLESRAIKDEQINSSHSLYYETGTSHYKAMYVRLNLNSVSGAWCSESIGKYEDQYVEIDLLTNHRVTAIATQGRFDSIEYVERYQVSYQRHNEEFFRMYNESGSWKVFTGNTDNRATVRNEFTSAIIARRIRVYPRGDEFSIYCFRMELYGCTWGHNSAGLIRYDGPLGAERQGVNMEDTPYDGEVSEKERTVTGGLGKLADDQYGQSGLIDSKGSPWVAYNSKTPELKFTFSEKRLVKQLILQVNNNGKDIQIFKKVDIYISSNNEKYTILKTYTTNKEQREKIGSLAIVVPLGSDVVTSSVKLRFTKLSNWLLISELVFMSDTYPPKIDTNLAPGLHKPGIKLFTEANTKAPTKNDKTKEKKTNSDSSTGLSFPIILTIALVTIVLAAAVGIFIYKSYKKQRKHEPATPTTEITPSALPQRTPSMMSKQDMALLYEERMLAMQQQQAQQEHFLQHQQQEHFLQQQQQLLANGMYMQPTNNAYNTKVVMS